MKLDRYSDAGNYIETIDVGPGRHLELPGKRTIHLGHRVSEAELAALNLYRIESVEPSHNPFTQGVREMGRSIVDTPNGRRSRIDLRTYDLPRAQTQKRVQERRAELAKRIRREARRRIEELAPAWRQRNWLADAIIRGNGTVLETNWAPIAAIRSRAKVLEEQLSTMPIKDLPNFDPSANSHWTT